MADRRIAQYELATLLQAPKVVTARCHLEFIEAIRQELNSIRQSQE